LDNLVVKGQVPIGVLAFFY